MDLHEVSLDVSKQPAVKEVLRIGQGDTGAPTLSVSVLDHGEPLDLDGFDVKFEMRKPQGGKYSVEGTASGNVAQFSLSGMPAGASDIAYVAIENGTARLSTQRIRVEVLEGSYE